MKKSAIPYYLSSIKTIVTGIGNWYSIPLLAICNPLTFTIKNGNTFIADNFMDVWTLKEVLLDDCYKTKSLIKNATVIDIGASIGDFSIQSALKAKRVISCEVNENRLRLLRANIHINQIKNITVIPKKIENLDSVFSPDIKTCDLLKIDCEGSEYPILLNAKIDTLKKVKKMVGELHFFNQDMKDDFELLKIRLKKAGFTLHTWSNPVHDSICFFSASR